MTSIPIWNSEGSNSAAFFFSTDTSIPGPFPFAKIGALLVAEITAWIDYFVNVVLKAQLEVEAQINFILKKISPI